MPELRAAPLADVVREVARHDSPVHNTRRFIATDTAIAGQPMRTGDAILVLLAAANRDPAANPDPDRFDPARPARRSFTFGHAVHACPGEIVATAIATAGVERLLAGGVDVRRLAENFSYRTSPNTRIPLFD
jgi:cytochrome P450